MRILHIQKVAVVGGSERHLIALLPALSSSGFDVRLLGLVGPDHSQFDRAAKLAGMELELVRLPIDFSPAAVLRVVRAVHAYRPDIVHTHLIHAHVYGQLAARLLRIPSAATAHNVHAWYRRPGIRMALRLAHNSADVTIAVSQHAADHLISLGIVEPGRVVVVPHGASMQFSQIPDPVETDSLRRELGLPGAAFLVGMAGRLIEGKGHASAIQAISALRGLGIDAHLVIAGSGPLGAALEGSSDAALGSRSVHPIGFQEDVGRFLRAMDVVVVLTEPTLGEGFGLVALDAMACGVPVVATRVGSLPELIIDGYSGILVEPGDAEGLATALSRLHHNPAARQELVVNAHARIESEFRLESMVKRVVDVYSQISTAP